LTNASLLYSPEQGGTTLPGEKPTQLNSTGLEVGKTDRPVHSDKQPTIKEPHMNIASMNDQQLIDAYADVVADEPARIRFLELLDQADADKHAFLRRPQALAESAKWYGEQGIAVFPLQPRSKIPMRGSRGCKDATTDIEQISSWWTQMPNANIGMVTGFQFDVIDVDGPDGFESLSHIKPIEDVLASVITPRGRHIYVKARGDRKNGTKLMDGIDIRAKGGYVVAPPSINAEGKIYTWLITPENLANHCE